MLPSAVGVGGDGTVGVEGGGVVGVDVVSGVVCGVGCGVVLGPPGGVGSIYWCYFNGEPTRNEQGKQRQRQ